MKKDDESPLPIIPKSTIPPKSIIRFTTKSFWQLSTALKPGSRNLRLLKALKF
jgi:hypothetical protein